MADEKRPIEFEDTPAKSASSSERGQANTVLIIIVAIVALLACGALAWFIFFRGDDETAEGDPTLVATAEEVTPPATDEPSVPATNTAVPTGDQVWASIVEEGKIEVGLSADYPPFEYYTENFLLDGFDVALIREIGDVLDLEVGHGLRRSVWIADPKQY